MKKEAKKKRVFRIVVAFAAIVIVSTITGAFISPSFGATLNETINKVVEQVKEIVSSDNSEKDKNELINTKNNNNNTDSSDFKLENDNTYDENREYAKASSEETIAIPGYSDITLTKEYPKIKLINEKDNKVYFKYIISNGNEVIYKTDAIKPGNMVEADLYEILQPGEYELTFTINTFDVETQEPRNGTMQTVKITIVK